MSTHAQLDAALDSIAWAGPELRNGLTSHAPMALEALCALGRADAMEPWLDRYRADLLPWPAPRERIAPSDWQSALGRPERVPDWRALLQDELESAPWPSVLDRWAARLAPGACSDATHGIIRVAHATRALSLAETPTRRRELACGLALWASTYQSLPAGSPPSRASLRPEAAIVHVPTVPEAERRFSGTITGSLSDLAGFAPFAPVIDLADLDGEPGDVVSELTRTFAHVYVANAHDVLSSIIFVHGVTSIAAVRSILPHVRAETGRALLRYAWQASCALYAAFGRRPTAEPEPPEAPTAVLVDRAIASGDEHAIKLAEACLREHAHAPWPAYLAAASHAAATLGG